MRIKYFKHYFFDTYLLIFYVKKGAFVFSKIKKDFFLKSSMLILEVKMIESKIFKVKELFRFQSIYVK